MVVLSILSIRQISENFKPFHTLYQAFNYFTSQAQSPVSHDTIVSLRIVQSTTVAVLKGCNCVRLQSYTDFRSLVRRWLNWRFGDTFR